MKVLFIGDAVGKPGRQAVRSFLERHRGKWDLVVLNGENLAGGRGISAETAGEMFSAGVHVISTGNHVWDRVEARALLEKERRIVRPGNYTEDLPGAGLAFVPDGKGRELAVINVSGRAFMDTALNCPFRTARELASRARSRTPFVLVDFHGEATSEKRAFFFHMDGRVSLVVGTHTHVQTNDDEISESGTGYLTDAGMTGVRDSVLGMKREPCLERFLLGVPARMEVAEGRTLLCGLQAELDPDGRCRKLVKIREEV